MANLKITNCTDALMLRAVRASKPFWAFYFCNATFYVHAYDWGTRSIWLRTRQTKDCTHAEWRVASAAVRNK